MPTENGAPPAADSLTTPILPPNASEVDESSDIELDDSGIASLLAELSREGSLPEGVQDPEPSPFSADEVDVTDSGWIQRVVEVQGWLGLDASLKGTDTPEATAKSLFRQIASQVAPAACITVGDVVTPTELGAQLLETRLNRAVEHRLAYEEMLEDNRSKSDASEEWRLYWEELGSQSRRPIQNINAKVESWKILSFKNNAEEGLLDLNPSYQRDIVWSNAESQLLIESILRGIPLPSVILTKEANSRRWQIVDGKQRLTAILRFIGRHPHGRAFAASKIGGTADLDARIRRFIRKNHLRPKDLAEQFLPFRLPRYSEGDPLFEVSGKFYAEVREQVIRVGNQNVEVRTLFESEASEYLIPVITYKDAPIQDIHRVFSLYNKQGKKLNAEELRNAMYHHLEFTKLLLVLSGDRADQRATLAPYLPADMGPSIDEMGTILRDLGFGTARFKRTKVLNWVCAMLFHEPNASNGQVSTPSTAAHINAMLDAVSDSAHLDDQHKLFQRPALSKLARDLHRTISTHQEAADGWSPKFRNKKGVAAKWEELPLVASLVGTFMLAVADKESLLPAAAPALRELTATLRAPAKAQNKTQWQYIARVAVSLIDHFQVPDAELGPLLKDRCGYNCLPTMRLLAASAD